MDKKILLIALRFVLIVYGYRHAHGVPPGGFPHSSFPLPGTIDVGRPRRSIKGDAHTSADKGEAPFPRERMGPVPVGDPKVGKSFDTKA